LCAAALQVVALGVFVQLIGTPELAVHQKRGPGRKFQRHGGFGEMRQGKNLVRLCG